MKGGDVHRGTTWLHLRNMSQQRQDNKKKKKQKLHLGADNAADAEATQRECKVAR